MQYYFIGGLGSNRHLAPLIDELGSVTFLDPIGNDSDRKRSYRAWFQGQISQTRRDLLWGIHLGGDLARYLAAEFPPDCLILLDGVIWIWKDPVS